MRGSRLHRAPNDPAGGWSFGRDKGPLRNGRSLAVRAVFGAPRPRPPTGRAMAAGVGAAGVDRFQASGAAIAGGARQPISAVMAEANAERKSHGSHSWLETRVPRRGGFHASGARATTLTAVTRPPRHGHVPLGMLRCARRGIESGSWANLLRPPRVPDRAPPHPPAGTPTLPPRCSWSVASGAPRFPRQARARRSGPCARHGLGLTVWTYPLLLRFVARGPRRRRLPPDQGSSFTESRPDGEL